ncbi:MAG: ribosome biogenesis GTPase Der [Candidatus Binatia bacterium]|nr:ribosome biogenesis GTPase Der [Candidatus Binatia bacterium]
MTTEARPLIVAITGRPNAGKSTLFNRLLKRRKAIVHDTPGVTRDENRAEIERDGRRIELIDTGGIEEAPLSGSLGERIHNRTYVVLADADVIVHLLDGQGGLSAADEAVSRRLRTLGKPVIYAVNKIDQVKHESRLAEFAALGADEIVGVSAAHGRGLGELWECVAAVGAQVSPFTPPEPEPEPEPGFDDELEGAEEPEHPEPTGPPRVALIGRPNAGKSSLLNRLVGYDRAIVDPKPGTTRDALDVEIEHGGETYLVVDTAGLRRPSRIVEDIEGFAASSSLSALARTEVAVLVIDATVGVTDQDMRLADLAWRRGRGLVIAVNKVDLAPQLAAQQCHDQIAARLPQWPPLPLVRISALEGTGMRTLYQALDMVVKGYRRKIPTPRLNELVHRAVENQPPALVRNKSVKVRYSAQIRRAPQEMALFLNRGGELAESYQRYLRHILREEFELIGVPLRIRIRVAAKNDRQAPTTPEPRSKQRRREPRKKGRR